MQIRTYEAADLDAVVSLWRACDLLRPWNDPKADIALCARTATSELFLGVEGGATVATVMTGSDGHRGWLYYLACEPSRRGEGLARAMVRHAERWLAESLGIGKVQLMIRAENTPVRAFYARLGYEEEPRVVMARRLSG